MQVRVTIPPKFARFHAPKRFKIAIGGRGSGKSLTISDLLIMHAEHDHDKIGCFREYQSSIDDSIHPLLEAEIDRLSVPGFTVQQRDIEHRGGGHFRFLGLARNPESVKSMFGFNKFFVEEAQTISNKSLKLLTPTLREDESEIWMAANPRSRADPFSQRFIVPFEKQLKRDGYYEDDLHTIIFVNYDDNPWFPDVLNQDRLFDKKNLSTAEYEHIWLGAYMDTVENAIIPVEWFDACIDAHVKLGFEPRGAKIVSHDPSDLGPDDKGLCYRHGSVVLDVQSKDTGDVNEGVDWALDYAIDHQADQFIWDCDGMGVSLRREVSTALDGKSCDFLMFKGSEGVDYPDQIYQGDSVNGQNKAKPNNQTFRNKRAQYYWALRDRCYATYLAVEKDKYTDPDEMISFSSNIKEIDMLRSEVCRIPRKPNSNGLIQIMTKKEMEKLEIESPNMGDSVMMSLAYRMQTKAAESYTIPQAYSRF